MPQKKSIGRRIIDDLLKHKDRYIKQFAMFSCCLQLGFSMGIVGPTIIDLTFQTHSNLTEAAVVLPCRAGGYAVGAFLTGIIYDYVNMQLLMVVTMTIAGLMTLVIPFLKSIWGIWVLFLTMGISLGAFEAGTDMFTLQLWGESKSKPFFLHFNLYFCYLYIRKSTVHASDSPVLWSWCFHFTNCCSPILSKD